MRASSAAQQVEKIITERREKLNQDAQKEQTVWRDMQQSLANERAKLSADQIRAKERELQDRITNAQKTFSDRNRIIQEAGQYGLAQIERMLIWVIRQVADEPRHELGAAPGAGGAEHQRVRHHRPSGEADQQGAAERDACPPEGVAPPMAAITPPAGQGAPAPTPAVRGPERPRPPPPPATPHRAAPAPLKRRRPGCGSRRRARAIRGSSAAPVRIARRPWPRPRARPPRGAARPHAHGRRPAADRRARAGQLPRQPPLRRTRWRRPGPAP